MKKIILSIHQQNQVQAVISNLGTELYYSKDYFLGGNSEVVPMNDTHFEDDIVSINIEDLIYALQCEGLKDEASAIEEEYEHLTHGE